MKMSKKSKDNKSKKGCKGCQKVETKIVTTKKIEPDE